MDTINPIGSTKRLEQPDIKHIKRRGIKDIKIMDTKRIRGDILNGKDIRMKNIIKIISSLVNKILIQRKLKLLFKK